MNLGVELGSSVRDAVSPTGIGSDLGQLAIRYVREEIEALDPIRFEEWQTKDDERTCPICGQLDGETWQSGEGFAPPVHDHCRCQRVFHHFEFRKRISYRWRTETYRLS